MADRTSVTLIVHDCPPNRVRDVLDIIDYYGLTDDDPIIADRIELGEPYVTNEIDCGNAEYIAAALIETAPELMFTVWEDPQCDWLGTVYRYTPDLGLFQAACDTNGAVLFGATEVRELVSANDATAIDAALGTAWETAISAAPAAASSAVIALPEDHS